MEKIKKKSDYLKVILFGFFVIYIIMLLKIVLFKSTSLTDIVRGHISTSYRSVNLVPFKTVHDFMEMMSNGNFLRAFSNVFGNIAIFMPLGYLLPLFSSKVKKTSMILLVSLGVSLIFEGLQYTFSLGSMDIDDVILNTLGGVLGYFIYIVIKRFIPDTRRIYYISILGGFFVFMGAFFIAKEQFGYVLGIMKHETVILGDEKIPQRARDLFGTFISVNDTELEFYNGMISENSMQKDVLTKGSVGISEDTKFYYQEIDEKKIHWLKTQSTFQYHSISKENLVNIESYSMVSIWKDQSSNMADVVVFSSPIQDFKGDTDIIESNIEENLIELSGIMEKVEQDNVVINLIMNQSLDNGSSMSVVGLEENATYLSIKLDQDAVYTLRMIKNGGSDYTDQPATQNDLVVGASLDMLGIKEDDYFIAKEIRINIIEN